MDTENNIKQGMSDGDDPTGAVKRRLDSAAESANRMVDTITNAVHPVVDQLATSAHQAVDSTASAMAGVSSTVITKGTQLRETQVRLTESCRASIRDQPLVSVGLAVTAGFLLSLLVRRD